MTASLFADLSWLPEAPLDFSTRCRDLLTSGADAGRRVRALANLRLNQSSLLRLGKAIVKLRQAGHSLAPLDPFRLAVLSNATTDFLVPSCVASAARHGLDAEVGSFSYGQVMQEVLSPDSAIYRADPQAVLIALDFRWFPFRLTPGDDLEATASVDAAIEQIHAIQDAIRRHSQAVCIFQTLAPPVDRLFGSLDRALPGTMQHMVDRFNLRLVELLKDTPDMLLDVAGLAGTVGLEHWHNPTLWNVAKVPFSPEFLPLYCDHIGRLLAAVRGKSRRCLILDLDNTLWGGVIGDDGLEGIQISQGDATGEAYLDVQRMALTLHRRGIVLAVSSKNTDAIARRPFLEHPEMLLTLDHIAVFQANWQDKAANIRAIANTLSLGLDSMVFLDDNPVERALVRTLTPEVAVPELPPDPALYARTLAAAGYFESVRVSAEDRDRTAFYQQNGQRAALQHESSNIENYLLSLAMEITFQAFDETGRTRIAQLIMKSNQFNLTTRRYSEREVETMQHDADFVTLQVRLKDVFGDNGMISVVLARQIDASTLEIDTWLMSCRVLGRRVEYAVLDELVLHARKRGCTQLIGRYIPTEKNALVRDHYATLGFTRVVEHEVEDVHRGATLWCLHVDAVPPCEVPMSIRRIGFEQTQVLHA